MPRLLLICEYPTLNGGERSMLATLGGVRPAGYDIFVACPPTGPLADALISRGVGLVPFRVLGPGGRRLPLGELRTNIQAEIVRLRPDVVHANSLSMSRVVGPVTHELCVPSLGHVRDIVKVSAAARRDLNWHRRLLAVSHATRRFHVAAGLDPARIKVLYNGVCLHEFQPRRATGFLHRQLQLPETAILAASIGQIGMRKGLDLVLEATREIVAAAPDLHWLLIGERHSQKAEAVAYERDLRRRAEIPPLAGHVHFLNRRDDVPAILNEVRLLVHGARQEPFGRVLLEAAASGVAVVATDVGGTREVFGMGHEASGSQCAAALLVAAEDAGALARAMYRVIQSPQLAAQLGGAARRRAEKHLDIRHTTRQLLAHYEHVTRRV